MEALEYRTGELDACRADLLSVNAENAMLQTELDISRKCEATLQAELEDVRRQTQLDIDSKCSGDIEGIEISSLLSSSSTLPQDGGGHSANGVRSLDKHLSLLHELRSTSATNYSTITSHSITDTTRDSTSMSNSPGNSPSGKPMGIDTYGGRCLHASVDGVEKDVREGDMPKNGRGGVEWREGAGNSNRGKGDCVVAGISWGGGSGGGGGSRGIRVLGQGGEGVFQNPRSYLC